MPLSTLGELVAGALPVVPVLVLVEEVEQLPLVQLLHEEHELRWNTVRKMLLTPPVEQEELTQSEQPPLER